MDAAGSPKVALWMAPPPPPPTATATATATAASSAITTTTTSCSSNHHRHRQPSPPLIAIRPSASVASWRLSATETEEETALDELEEENSGIRQVGDAQNKHHAY